MKYATTHESRELYFYISHTQQMMRQHFEPVARAMEKRQRRGDYDTERALVAFRYVADDGAKAYVAEHGARGDIWHKMFSVSDRDKCARELRDTFESETACGNGWLDR